MIGVSQNIVICLASSNSWYGRAIRRITQSNVNHAFVAYYSHVHKGWQALQTDERGLVEVPVNSLKYEYKECYEFPDLNLLIAIPKCRHLIGDAYDFLGILGFLLKIFVWRLVGRRIVNPLHKKGELFCSEFVVLYLQRVQGMFEWVMKVKPSGVAPGGNSKDLGVPSLREMFIAHDGVKLVTCPFGGEEGKDHAFQ